MTNNFNNNPAIVLLHGGGLNQAMWLPQLEALDKEFDIVAIDLPGHGRNADVVFTLDGAIESVARSIEAGTSGKVIVAGLSLGGYVAIAHAAKYPGQISGLFLSGCCVSYFGFIGAIARLNTIMLRYVSSKRQRTMQVNMLKEVTTNRIIEEMIRVGLVPGSARDGLNEVIGVDFLSKMKKIETPVLIANGENDRLNRKFQNKFVVTLHDGSARLFPGCGHLCSLEKPDLFTNYLLDFSRVIAR